MEDYSITYKYLVEQMEHKYGISPDNEKPRALTDIFRLMYEIFDEFVDAKRAEYQKSLR